MVNLIGINGKIGAGKDTIASIIQYLMGEHDEEGSFKDFNEFIKANPIPTLNSPKMWGSGWEIKKFAGKLKEVCSLLTGIPVTDFEKQEVKDSYLGEEWNITFQHDSDGFLTRKMKVRELLQKVGTECLRDNLHQNVHVNALFADYKHTQSAQAGFLNPGKGPFEPIGKGTFGGYPKWIISDLRFPNELQAIKDRNGISIRVTRPGTVVGSHPSEIALDNAEFDYEIENSDTIEELIVKVKIILTQIGAYELLGK